MGMRGLLSAFLVTLLPACGGTASDPDASPPVDAASVLPLSPGVVRVPCEGALRTVGIDGDRVVVVTRDVYVDEEVFDAQVCVSDDRARTFRALTIPEAALSGMETYRVWVRGDRAWLVLADRVLGRTLAAAHAVVARALDLDTGALGDPVPLDVAAYHFGDDVIVGFHRTGAPGDAVRRAVFVRLDLASGTVTRQEAPAPGGDCPEPPFGRPFASADGDAFLRACYRDTELCVQRARASGPSFDEACVTYPAWPLPWYDPQEDAVLDGAVRRVRTGGGRVYASTLSPTAAAPALGPELALGEAVSATPIGANLLDLTDGSTDPVFGLPNHRTVTLRGEALVPIVYPSGPCLEGGLAPECSAASQVVASFGDGAWLVAYGTLVTVVREGEGTPGPFVVPSDRPANVGGDWIQEQPADSQLERLCAFAASCPPSPGVYSPAQCVDYWERVRAGTAESDAAYERFLATPLGDCAALDETFPARFGDCTARCLPDGRAISCATEGVGLGPAYRRVRECAAEGATCALTTEGSACSIPGSGCEVCDPSGRAVRCEGGEPDEVVDCAARGLVCEAGTPPSCYDPLPAGRLDDCDGTIFVRAVSGSAIHERLDCARGRMPCRAGYGCSFDGIRTMGCVPGAPSCVGTRLRWDVCGYARWVDCLDLGATGCDRDHCAYP